MMAKSGGYFGRPFKGCQGFTQGDPLFPTIFNVFVDSVIHHWVTVVMPTEAGTGGLVLTIINLVAYLCASDGQAGPVRPKNLDRPGTGPIRCEKV